MAEMYASRGVAGAGLGLGIAGTALGVLNGGLGKIIGTSAPAPNPTPVHTDSGCDGMALMAGALAAMTAAGCSGSGRITCSEDHLINRYEAAQQARIAELETEVKLRDANTYTMGEMNKMRNYVDDRFGAIDKQLCAQAIHNQRTEDSFALANRDLLAVKTDLMNQIQLEAERRCCADNAIVNYSNATFYPKMVADVTVGTTTTAQTLYNPIPKCGCCGGGNG